MQVKMDELGHQSCGNLYLHSTGNDWRARHANYPHLVENRVWECYRRFLPLALAGFAAGLGLALGLALVLALAAICGFDSGFLGASAAGRFWDGVSAAATAGRFWEGVSAGAAAGAC